MLENCDKNGDGKISCDEFIDFLKISCCGVGSDSNSKTCMLLSNIK